MNKDFYHKNFMTLLDFENIEKFESFASDAEFIP